MGNGQPLSTPLEMILLLNPFSFLTSTYRYYFILFLILTLHYK